MKNKIPLLIGALLLSSCQNSLIDYSKRMAKPGGGAGSLSLINYGSSSQLSSFPNSYPQSSSSNPPFNEDYLYCPQYGPFQIDSNDFDATFFYAIISAPSQNIIERIRLIYPPTNSVLYMSSKGKKYYTNGTTNTVSFTIPLHSYWSNSGLTLKFEIVNGDTYQFIKEYGVTFYPPSCDYVSGQGLKKEKYISRSLGFYGNGLSLQELIETIDFTNLGDYLDVDYYYLLDLRRNKIKYSGYLSFSYREAYLRFEDASYLFPYCSHDAEDYINLPLTLNYANGEISIAFKNNFYINKRTLQISEQYRQGFVLTDRFYLPINGKEIFNDSVLYIDFYELGQDKITGTITLKYDVDRNLIGLCTDGDYCVIGGRR